MPATSSGRRWRSRFQAWDQPTGSGARTRDVWRSSTDESAVPWAVKLRRLPGPLGIYELFVPDKELADQIAHGSPPPASAPPHRRTGRGMHTLLDDALAKTRAGLVPLSEICGQLRTDPGSRLRTSISNILEKTLAAIQKSGHALIKERNKLIPPRVVRANAHDVSAAKQAERLPDAKRVRAQAEPGNGPVPFFLELGFTKA